MRRLIPNAKVGDSDHTLGGIAEVEVRANTEHTSSRRCKANISQELRVLSQGHRKRRNKRLNWQRYADMNIDPEAGISLWRGGGGGQNKQIAARGTNIGLSTHMGGTNCTRTHKQSEGSARLHVCDHINARHYHSTCAHSLAQQRQPTQQRGHAQRASMVMPLSTARLRAACPSKWC